MPSGRLGRLLKTTSEFKSAAEEKPQRQTQRAVEGRYLGIDTRPLTTSYGAIADQLSIGGPSAPSQSPETYRNSHLLFNVPEEVTVDDDDLEMLLEEDGLYLGSYNHLIRIHAFVPVTSLLVWLLAVVPLLLWPIHSSTRPHAPNFPTPVPELLLSSSFYALSHILIPYIFALAGELLPNPTATSVLGTALHVILRNALRTATFPMLALTVPGGIATFRTPAFRSVWWLALGWSLAEVTAGIVQWYETLDLYRDVLVPESDAHELVASVVAVSTRSQQNGGSDRASPPPTADERLRECLSRGEDGDSCTEAHGSPVRGRRPQPSWMSNEAAIQLEVDKDFDELVAVKAREELEELYGFPAIVSFGSSSDNRSVADVVFREWQRVPVFVLCLLRVASILLSLGIFLLLSAGYLTSPLATPRLEDDALMMTIPPARSNGMFWGTFFGVFGVNWGLSLLHTPVFLPRVGVHVVAYLGFLVGLGMLFTGLGMWDALS
ncbi:hypothetical protein F5148DRAFT_1289711 [Russula earlei]|uniref:Uncharacterized protein n=1 Tax=Russula earlei TaxID=71964 RepID=A0ACC0TYU1_9AGAM|nr:hypothetical protein F5148DRAFT_1289711 [Russula earlei]